MPISGYHRICHERTGCAVFVFVFYVCLLNPRVERADIVGVFGRDFGLAFARKELLGDALERLLVLCLQV